MKAKSWFALAIGSLALGSLGSTRLRAVEVQCPLTTYFTEQWDTYAEFNWQCNYGVDYVYISPMPNSSRPYWYVGMDYYWGSDWSGYISTGYWQPYFYNTCNWVLAGIYDVWMSESEPLTYGHQYHFGINYDDNSTWGYDFTSATNSGLPFSDIQAYYTQKRAVSTTLVEKVTVNVHSVLADYIGTTSGVDIYATNVAANDYVLIRLSVSPADANITVNWSGGEAGADQLQRKVSRSALIESGESVSASVCGTTVFNGKIHVFKAPVSGFASVTYSLSQDNSIVQSGEAGRAVSSPSNTTQATKYEIYYENGHWYFALNPYNYIAKWGIDTRTIAQGGRGDVTNPNANPFPEGLNMSGTQQQRKQRAKDDLTPQSDNSVLRVSYWSSAITSQHELFHIADYRNFLAVKLAIAESWIESQSVVVTTANLNPSGVLAGFSSSFDAKIDEAIDNATNDFMQDAEPRARAYVADDYTILATSIIP